MLKNKEFVLIVPPSSLVKTYRRMSPEEKTKIITESKVSDERLAIDACYPCPICGERYTTSYYENRAKYNNNNQRRASENTENADGDAGCGLIISERELGMKGFFHKEMYYVTDFTCTTCHSVYRSRPYRKNHYVKMSV